MLTMSMCLATRWFIVKLWTGERRKRLRSGHFGGRKLRIDDSGRLLAAKVVDFSDRGFGVEMSSSLHAGLSVSFVGAGLQGRAQVVHCEPDHDGWFRVGFAFEQVTFRKLDSFIRTLWHNTVDVRYQPSNSLDVDAARPTCQTRLPPLGKMFVGAATLILGVLRTFHRGIRSGAKLLRRNQRSELSEQRSRPRLPANEPGQVEWVNAKGERQSEKISIRDRSQSGVGFGLVQQLQIGQMVWVATEKAKKCKAIVRHCHEETGGYFVGAIRVLRERRRFERQPVGANARLHWEAPGGGQAGADVLVRDGSEFGLQLLVASMVPVPAVVRLEGRKVDCFGSTCYSTPYQGQYLVGLHLIPSDGCASPGGSGSSRNPALSRLSSGPCFTTSGWST